jgi:CHAT domain-containing protein
MLSDFAISSYTPTIRVLFDRMKTGPVLKNKKSGLFMISQADAPGLPSIPKATEEVRVIQRLTKDYIPRVRCLEGPAATVDRTSIEMEAYSSVHFACHANQNAAQPLKSGFSLHDGRLELSSIIQKRLVGADLAFLSACQTSTGDGKLSEEAVHLAAGMLAAGYRGAVATMWSIRDRYASGFAEDFYTNLIEGEDSFSGEHAARAVHHATRNLRRKLALQKLDLDLSLLVWVPYVHFGL